MKKITQKIIGVLLAVLSCIPLLNAQNVTQSGFTSITTPLYMSSGTSTRLPVMFRATVSGLTANTTYRYFVQAVTNSAANGGSVDFGGTNSGAGNPLLINVSGTTYTYSTGASLTSAGNFETFTSDATGSYTGWFGFVNTGSGRFNAGNLVYPCITIGNGTTGTPVLFRRALDVNIIPLAYSTSAGASNGTFLQEISSSASQKNLTCVYDNIAGTGRPLYIAPIENTGVTIASVTPGYTTSSGGWNAIIPNNNANGVKRIEQRSVVNGTIVGCAATDADGIWATGSVNTVNPNGGTTPRVISSVDASLDPSYVFPSVSLPTSNSPICAYSPLTLNATATGTPAVTLSWSGTGTFDSNTINNPIVTGAATGNYILTATNVCGSASNSLSVTVNQAQNVTASDVTGCNGNPIILSGLPAGGTYSIANPYTGPNTTYTYSYTDGNGCSATSVPANATNNSAPAQPAAFTTKSTFVYLGQMGVLYTVPFVVGITYNWTYSGTGATINGSGNSVTIDYSSTATNGTLSVTATSSGCTSTARTLAIVLNAPITIDATNFDYSFVTVGCNRVDYLDTAITTGDPDFACGKSTANVYQLKRLFTEISHLNPLPHFLIMTGDIVMGYLTPSTPDTTELAKQLTAWRAIYESHPLSSMGITLIAVPGNHETQDKAAGKHSFVAAENIFTRIMAPYIHGSNGPGIGGPDGLATDQSKLTYSFDYGGDHYLMIDTDPTGQDNKTPYHWIASDLQAARANHARHIFAFGHKPAYSSPFTPAGGLDAASTLNQRDSLWKYFEMYNVEAMFSAHEHLWDSIHPHAGKSWQVINGDGGTRVEPIWVGAGRQYYGYTIVNLYTNRTVNVMGIGRNTAMSPTVGTSYPINEDINPSTVRNNFFICLTTTSTSTVSACNSYFFGNTTYTVSGTYTYTTTNASGCDSVATLNLTINTIPNQPSSFTIAPPFIYPGQNGVVYTVPNDGNATSYTWAYSGNGATINGTGNSVTIDFSSSATAGTLSVTANTICGSSPATTINIGLNPPSFAAGNLVVLQTSTTVNKSSSPITLKEFTTTGTPGMIVSIPSANNNNYPFQTSGIYGGSEGFLSTSADGKKLMLGGYATSQSFADITATTAAAVTRAVGTVNQAGFFSQVATSNTFFNGNDIRGAISDGTNYWASGASVNNVDGINYFGPGTQAGLATGAIPPKAYGLRIFNGNIYYATQKGGPNNTVSNLGIFQLGTGLPTSGTVSVSQVIGTGSVVLPEDFSFNPAGDVCYIASNLTTANGGVRKYTKSGAVWSYAYTLGTATQGAYGLVVDYTGANPVIYATTFETGGNRVIKITDTGAGSVATTLVPVVANVYNKGISFAPVDAGTPTVNLNISTNAGTEAATTVVTVTAVASSPVSGDQAVALGVSGTGITTGDFTLSNSNITIPNGATSASVTFTVVDDIAFEPTEVATITISGPSSGLVLGTTSSQTVSIADNDNTAPTISMNVSTTSDFIDGGVAVSPTSPYTLSGVITDITDPASTLGIDFAVNDNETGAASLTVTATSSNTTAVPNANVVITGTGGVRNVKITPATVGYSNITISVSDGVNTTTYVVAYGASARTPDIIAANTVWHTGMSDASDAIAIDDNYYITGDDEFDYLNVYSRSGSGLPALSYDFSSYLALPDPGHPEADIEAATRSTTASNKMYWAGSMSNGSAPFNNKPNRDRLFATTITGTGASTAFTFGGYVNVRAALLAWGDANGYAFTASSQPGVDSKSTSGYALEGMVFGPDNTTLYLGMRAPLVPTATRTNAVIAPILNFEAWFNNGNPSGAPTFGSPIELNLNMRGIRDIQRLSNGTYIIVAGDAGEGLPGDLYKWTGYPSDAPVLVPSAASGVLKMEGLIPVNNGGQLSLTQLQVVTDGGDVVLYNDGFEAKDLGASLRKFRSDILTGLDLNICTGFAATVSPAGATTFCSGDSVSLNATAGNNNNTYLWSTGETTQAITASTTSTYSVTVTNTNSGCVATATQNVTAITVTATATAGIVPCSGGTTTVVVGATGGTSPYTGTGTFTVSAGTVSYTVTDANGCSASTSTTVTTATDITSPTIYLQNGAMLAGVTGANSSQTPFLLPTRTGAQFKSIISANNTVGGYKMSGIPDGLGAFDNNDGTFTVLMNHELQNTVGAVRAHGSIGAFVSKWVINKNDLSVVSGSDLMTTLNLWNGSAFVTQTAALTRFCSADLPVQSAFYNSATQLGTQEKLFMNGEESGTEGRAFAHIVTGPNAGTSYQLPKLGKMAYENAVANPATGDKTVVGCTDDGTGGQVYFYIGNKTNTGTEIDKAGLNNGIQYGVKVTGFAIERVNSTTLNAAPAAGTHFDLVSMGDVSGITGAVFNTNSNTAVITQFSRPEDGAWDPSNPSDFYFVTTDQLDQVMDGVGSQIGRSKLWKLHFTNIATPEIGGDITAMLDGTEGQVMLDNLGIDNFGHIIMQEDVGNAAHNGKIWQYTIATDVLTMVGKHDPARFGNIGVPATPPFNADEESSGAIDVSSILGPGMWLMDDQAHSATGMPSDVAENGQLFAFFNPDSYGNSSAKDTVFATTNTACTATGVNLGTPATADNCTVASVINDAPAAFPVGTTNVTWTVTDGNANTATSTQYVIVTDATAPVADVASLQVITDQCSVTVTPPTATDNCAGSISATTTDATSYSTQGTYTIHWTYTDGHGNNATQNQTVTVLDNTAPIIAAPADVTMCSLTSGVTVALGTPTVSDNCGTVTFTNDAPATFQFGTTMVTWTANDGHGNTSTATQNVTISQTPVGSASPVVICNGAPANIALNSTVAGTTFTWTAALTVGGVIGYNNCNGPCGTSISDVLTNTGNVHGVVQYTVTPLFATCSGTPFTVDVTIGTAPATPVISGPAVICGLASAIYTVAAVPEATNYTWTVPTGVTGMTITSGQGTTALHVNISAGTVIGNVTCVASNSCGSSSMASLAVTKKPGLPGAITGPTSVCGQTTATYSIAPVFNTTSYTWTLPAGVSITSGFGTTSITVSFASNFVSGNISVSAVNACGSVPGTALFITGNVPAIPGTLSGPANVCGVTSGTYSIPPVAGATGYIWTITGAGTINGSNTGTSVSVTLNGSSAGTISCAATNLCGTGPTRTLVLSIAAAQPATISGPNNTCGMSTATYSVTSLGNGYTYNWVLPAGMSWAGGIAQTTSTVTVTIAPSVGGTTGIGILKVSSTNSCGQTSAFRTMTVTRCLNSNAMNNGVESNSTTFSNIYPNPTTSAFTIDVTSDENKEVTVEVYDVLGSIVISEKHQIVSDTNTLKTNIEQYKNGMYFVRLLDVDANVIHSQTVIKQ